MNIVLGFGSTERDFEEAETLAFQEFCADEYRAQKCDYVTDELVASCGAWLGARAKDVRAAADAYDKAESPPARYSSYWASVLGDASHIVAIYRFSHINRKHAMSPDGWAIMQTRKAIIGLCSIDMI